MVFINLLADTGDDISGLPDLVDLNPFGVQYRYESLADDDEVLDRTDLLNKIEQLFSRIEKLLS